MVDPGPHERRIGERRPVAHIEVTWVYQVVRKSGPMKRSKVQVVERPGRIVDVSISGAAIEGPIDPGLPAGAEAVIRTPAGDMVVKVRRLGPTDRAGVLRYGVEFVELSQRVKDQIHSVLSSGRPGEEVWFRAL